MIELLTCPFCGGEADVMLSQSRWGQSYTIHHDANVKCPAEYIGAMSFATEAEAIAAWNTRAERTCRDTDENEWHFVCSACGYEQNGYETWNYCPNCGARVEVDR